MSDPKISLIVTTHNSEKYIEKALESARVQSLDDIEIICVDSSTEDSTPQILNQSALEDSRIRVVNDSNSSYGHKINVGIDEARGKYLVILEADDLLKKDSLKVLWDAACRHNHQLDFIKAEFVEFYSDGKENDKVYHYSEAEYDKVFDFQENTCLWAMSWNHIWTGLYKLDFLRKNNIRLHESPGASYQDTGFSILCNIYARKVCFIPDTVYMYRVDNEESSVKNNEKYLLVKEEFDWAQAQLQERKLLNERNYREYKSFKRESYEWNMSRLSGEYKVKFKEAVITESESDIKVSILMPSLNVARYIRQCMDSVLAQTLKDIEIICIDAGSTDGTLEILKDYEKVHQNIHVIISDKKSYGHQMNLGLEAAKGEYIGIVETDDFIEENMFEILYRDAKWHDVDVVKAMPYDRYEFDNNRSVEIPVVYDLDTNKIRQVIFTEEYTKIHTWDNNIWNGLYRRSLIEENNIRFRETPGAAYQDIGFQQRVLNFAYDYANCPHYQYHYRKDRPGSSTVSDNCVKYIYGEYKDLLDDPGLKESRYTAVYERMIPAFLDEFVKYLMWIGFDKSKISCMEEIQWFYDKTLYAMDHGILRPNNVHPARWPRIKEFSQGVQEFIDAYKDRTESLRQWLAECIQTCRDRKVVLFGSGKYGEILLLFLIRNGIMPYAICDNDMFKLTNSYFGINVLLPEDAVIKYPEAAYILASKNQWRQMSKQLEGMGVPQEQIVLFNGTEAGVVEEMKKQPVIYEERAF